MYLWGIKRWRNWYCQELYECLIDECCNNMSGENKMKKGNARGGKSLKKRRPEISDADLRGSRGNLFSLFDSTWADTAWQLENLYSPDDVRSALKVLPADCEEYAIRALLRPTTVPETASLSRRALARLDKQIPDLRATAYKSVVELSDRVQVLERMLMKKMTDADRAALEQTLTNKMTDAERITLEEDLAESLDRLHHAQEAHASLIRESNRVREELMDRRSDFARIELVKYCKSDRSRLNPRRLANAVAGFPFIGWRQSSKRCVKLQTDKSLGGHRYLVTRTIRRIVISWDQDAEADLVEHARHYLEKRNPVPAEVFSDLRAHWRFLRLSITEALDTEPEFGAMPYVIASGYFRRRVRFPSELEKYLAEKERIASRGKISDRS